MKNAATPKQMSVLFRFTLLKFWQPAAGQQPNIQEACHLLDLCFRWLNAYKARQGAEAEKAAIVSFAQKWFPDWDGSDLGIRFKRRSGSNEYEHAHKNNNNSGTGGNNPKADDNSSPNKSEGGEDSDSKVENEKSESTGGEQSESDTQNQGEGDGKGSDNGDADSSKNDAEAQDAESPEGSEGDGEGEENKKSPSKQKQGGKNSEAEQEKQPEQQPGQQSEQQKQGEGKGKGQKDEQKDEEQSNIDPTVARVLKYIIAGLRNFYLHGAAGTGKTTITKLLGLYLSQKQVNDHDWPVTVLSCNSGTSPSEIRGFYYPTPRPSTVMTAIAMPGIVVLDEFTTLDPSVAAVANALLANGEIETSTGLVRRHPDCVIIVTSNTLGVGANREYIGNNQLDAATLDRFSCGQIHVDYSAEFESKYDKQVVEFVYQLRTVIKENGYRRVASTRAIQAATALKRAKCKEWMAQILSLWTPEERAAIHGWGEESEKEYFGYQQQ
jgi:hypothetical protein